ncbi:MAG TPA: ComEC/Rec2 family competence protein, partial [Flavobacteriia bacterium]|nr:ComEC/Rec2 family competence protein [Flavobacteriia bacterium]
LTGMSASIARATTMFTAIAISILVNRKSGTINALFISAFLLLLIHPLYLFDIGFQLSYLAVFSIVYFNPIFDKLWRPKNKIIRYLFKIFTVSISAQIGILPLSLYYFHQFPALFFISGLVVLPVLGILLLLGFFVILLAYFDILPNVIATLYSFLIEQLNQFILFISKQEDFIFKQLYFSFLMLISTYVIIIVFYRLIKLYSYKRLALFLISILSFQLVLFYEKYFRESKKEFIVFNHSKNTIIGIRNGKNFVINHSPDTLLKNTFLNEYLIGTGVSINKTKKKIKNYYTFNKHKILVIDSLSIYKMDALKPDILVLRNSPKINLERVIKIVKPQSVVVDASNYTSYTKYYKQKSAEMNTKFYNTKQNGAFILKR